MRSWNYLSYVCSSLTGENHLPNPKHPLRKIDSYSLKKTNMLFHLTSPPVHHGTLVGKTASFPTRTPPLLQPPPPHWSQHPVSPARHIRLESRLDYVEVKGDADNSLPERWPFTPGPVAVLYILGPGPRYLHNRTCCASSTPPSTPTASNDNFIQWLVGMLDYNPTTSTFQRLHLYQSCSM